jgi:hypothetical protein
MTREQNKFLLKAFVGAVVVVGLMMWIWPTYKVWFQEMRGKAALMEAKQDRQVLIEEAEAKLEAEKLNAKAEVERAKGMSEAMEIEGGALTQEYIHYLWVRSNSFDQSTTIYVPTETNLPILEASRFKDEVKVPTTGGQ